MAGQSAGQTLSSVKSAINEVKSMGGVTGTETSMIGGAGRRGGAGEGPEMAPHKNVCAEFLASMGGEANTGQTGENSGSGKTF
jgi:hypothetical protein